MSISIIKLIPMPSVVQRRMSILSTLCIFTLCLLALLRTLLNLTTTTPLCEPGPTLLCGASRCYSPFLSILFR